MALDILKLVQEQGEHVHLDGVEVPGLVNGDKNYVFPGPLLQVGGFRGLQGDRKKERAAAGGADPEIASSPVDVCNHVLGDGDIFREAVVVGLSVHYSHIVDAGR